MDNPRQEPPVSAGDTPNDTAGAPPVGSPLARGTLAKTADGSEFKWLGNQWRDAKTGRMASRAQKAELNSTTSTESIAEAEAEPTLSKDRLEVYSSK